MAPNSPKIAVTRCSRCRSSTVTPPTRASVRYFDGTGDTNAPPQGRFTPSGNNLPSAAALNALFATYGTTAAAPGQALSINRDGTLFATAPARNLRLTAADGFGLARDGSGQVVAFTPFESGTLLNPLRRYNAYATFDYEVSDSVTVYAAANYTHYQAINQQRGTLNGTAPVATIPVTNPFLPADLRTVLASRPNPNASFNYSFFGDRVGPQLFEYDYDVGQLTLGAKGEIWRRLELGPIGQLRQDDLRSVSGRLCQHRCAANPA